MIAEIKLASPSEGAIAPHADPVQIADAYRENGAAALSVLTERDHFGGSPETLRAVRSAHPSAPLLCDLELAAGASLTLDAEPAGEGAMERAVFVLSGEVRAGEHVLTPDHLAVLVPSQPLCLLARTASRVLLLGGPPLDGPRYIDWNFVSSSPERIAAARAACP